MTMIPEGRTVSASAMNHFLDQGTDPAALAALFEQTSLIELIQQLSSPTLTATEGQLLILTLEKLLRYDEVRQAALNTPELRQLLDQGISSPSPAVRALVASLVEGLCKGDTLAAACESGFFQASAKLLADPDIKTAESAVRAILGALKDPAARRIFFSDAYFQVFESALTSKNDATRIRALHLSISIGMLDSTLFNECEKRGCYDRCIKAFFTTDLLVKMTSIELIEMLGSFPAGIRYLSRAEVPQQLVRELVDPFTDDAARVCIVRVLANIIEINGDLAPMVFKEAGGVFPAHLKMYLECPVNDPSYVTKKLCAIHSWASLCVSSGGASMVLDIWPNSLEEIVRASLHPSNGEISKAGLDAWTKVVELGGSLPDAFMTTISTMLVPALMRQLIDRPFPDIRAFTYRLFASLARFKFAVQALFASEAHCQLLTNYQSDSSKEAKYGKHELVTAIFKFNSQWLPSFVDDAILDELERLKANGPFYVPKGAIPDVDRSAA